MGVRESVTKPRKPETQFAVGLYLLAIEMRLRFKILN